MAAGDLTLNLHHLTGLGGMSPNADDARPLQTPGTISFLVDAFGFRIFKYIRAITTATKGQMVQHTGDNATPNFAVTNQTGTYTTKAVLSGFTVNDHQGKVAYVIDDAGGAGAAPEGEMTVVASNTATDIIFEPELPLSAALASGDDLTLVSTYQAEAGTAGILAQYVQGAVVGNSGITAGQYGWVCQQGLCLVNTTTCVTAGVMLQMGAASVLVPADTAGAESQEEWVGVCLGISATDQVASKSLAKLLVFTAAGTGTIP